MPNLMTTHPEMTDSDEDLVQPKGATFKIFTGALKAIEKEVGGVSRKYLVCTASSTIKDLHGDEMTADCVMGMAPQAKAKSMTIFLNHSYKWPEDVFGKTTDAGIVQRGTNADGNPIYDLDLEIQLNEENTRATESWRAIKDQGIKAGISIGAMIEDYEFIDEEAGWWGGLRIKAVDLLEASVVGIPANQRSWVVNALKALGAPKVIMQKAVGLGDDVSKAALPTKTVTVTDNDAVKAAQFQYLLPDGTDVTNSITVKEIALDPVTMEPLAKSGEEDTNTDVEDSAAPEGEIQDESDKSADALDPADGDEATEGSSPDLESAVDRLKAAGASGALLELMLEFLEEATGEVAALRTANKQLTTERDEARQDVLKAAEFVERLAATPLGRKTQFAGPVSTFRARYGGLYDEGFLKLLEERNSE